MRKNEEEKYQLFIERRYNHHFTPLESLKPGDVKNIYIYKVFLFGFTTIEANVKEYLLFQDLHHFKKMGFMYFK